MKIAALYEQVTNRIIFELESGNVIPWLKPWKTSRPTGSLMPHNFATGHAYRGINVPLLWHETATHGYDRHLWLTYKQAEELEGQVRKGEKGTHIVFTKKIVVKGEDEDPKKLSMLKTYCVFNVQQVDGLKQPEPITMEPAERNDTLDSFVEKTAAKITHGGNQPAYISSGDFITMPHKAQFKSEESYYATTFHELGHNAAIRIMPHGLRWRPDSPALAMRLFGIIRALPGTRGVDRQAGTGPAAWLGRRRERAPFPSSACRHGCRFGWSRRSRDQARAR